MRVFARIAIAVLIAGPVLATARQPQAEGRVEVTVSYANSADGPVQILGLRPPQKVGSSPAIILRNDSGKRVESISLIAGVGVWGESARYENTPLSVHFYPEGRVVWYSSQTRDFGGRWEKAMLPGEVIEIENHAFEAHRMAYMAGPLRSGCLHAVAVVQSVKFEDEPLWSVRGGEAMFDLWKDALVAGGAARCAGAAGVDAKMGRLEFSGIADRGEPTGLDQRQVEAYSFTCPVKTARGKLGTVCKI